MNLIMMPFKHSSGGAKMLSKALQLDMITPNDHFARDDAPAVLVWGAGSRAKWEDSAGVFINHPNAIMNAIEKRDAFRLFQRYQVPSPASTTRQAAAIEWLREGAKVFCREQTQGFAGHGITVARTPEQIVPAKLYTKYQEKVNEYRVHVMGGQAFYANIKRKRGEPRGEKDSLIRSGELWFFAHMDHLPSAEVCRAAEKAVAALGLDFGGVDVGEDREGKAWVYEVNTAPEMGPNTTSAYVKAMKRHYGQYKNKNNVCIQDL